MNARSQVLLRLRRRALVVFIVVPRNSGLKEYNDKALADLNAKSSKVIRVRGEDVPLWVSRFIDKGFDAIGLTGEDLFIEYQKRFRDTELEIKKRIEWKDEKALYGKPALCLIRKQVGSDGDKDRLSKKKALTIFISSKYKAIADEYLKTLEKDSIIEKVYINGCVEPSCSEGIADYIVDIVKTGSSLKRYGLEIVEKIMQSDFVIVGGRK